ncbi:MAG: hypothetical protein QM736_02030 [Vicinamibacterales bacterium]
MLYIGHFSFAFDSKERRKPAQPWHGYFTAVVEARDANAALKKLDAVVRRTTDESDLFADVSEIFLESCVEVKSVPKAGFLAHVALEEGESLGSISTTLPAVNRKYATSYHVEPETLDEDGSFDAEPFIVLKRRAAAKKRERKRETGQVKRDK